MWEKVGVFFGEFEHALDAKNRVMVPSRMRESFPTWGSDGFMLTRGLDGCLVLYTPGRFQELVERFNQLSFTNTKVRQFQRLMFSKAIKVVADKTGRILIPDFLKKLANFKKDLIFVGVSDRIEVWDKERWLSYESDNSDDFEKIAEHIFE